MLSVSQRDLSQFAGSYWSLRANKLMKIADRNFTCIYATQLEVGLRDITRKSKHGASGAVASRDAVEYARGIKAPV